jgi:outer membrane receptor protein involved in Fe transport
VALLWAATPASAQTLTGAISGRVVDENGGALPGATVTLTGKTGTRTATTDSEGAYRFVAVETGSYDLTAQVSGFSPRKEAVAMSIGRQVTLDFSLKVGSLSESLDVVGEAPVVDVSSTATNNTLSQSVLFNMPLDRRSFLIHNYAPGINDGSAFGGASGAANGLLLDGVDTRDPYSGTPWTFYNYNIIEEIQFQGLGAAAEYGAYTGAVVNTVSRSGGNRYAGLFDVYYTNDGLGSSNVSDAVKKANPALGAPEITKKYVDFTAQLSGPIQKDKLFFFASIQRFYKTEDPSGPLTERKELSHRLNTKLTYQPGPNDTFSATVQADDYSINGRPSPVAGALLSTPSMTVSEDAPEVVWNAQWRHLFGSRTFLEAKYLGWWGYYYLDPEHNMPLHFDGATGAYSGGAGAIGYSDRSRDQLNASVSHYAEAFGHHDFKFGVEIERSKVRERYHYTTYFYDYGGVPVSQYVYGYDLQGNNQRNSAFAQDSWKLNERLTINAGLRYDGVRGVSPVLDRTVYTTNNWAPRIGFAYDLTGDHKTVLKAHYGQYYEGALFSYYKGALPGVDDFVVLDANTGQETGRTPTPINRVDPNIKHPRVDELTAGFERALSSDFRMQVTGIWRDNKNFISSVLPQARWTPVTLTNALTGGPITAYRLVNPTQAFSDYLITNPDGFQYLDPSGHVIGTAEASRKYKGLMLVLTKRFTDRWQLQGSYVLSKAEGTVDSDDDESTGGGRQFQNPSRALVNAFGEVRASRTHEVKIYASYRVPVIDLGVNAYFRVLSGRTWTPYERYSSSDLNFTASSVGRRVLLEPRGSERLDPEHILDLRFEKTFQVRASGDRLGLYADFINLFNSGLITRPVERTPSETIGGVAVPVGGPRQITPARQVTFGARWSF